jgi:hypothetical protein
MNSKARIFWFPAVISIQENLDAYAPQSASSP